MLRGWIERLIAEQVADAERRIIRLVESMIQQSKTKEGLVEIPLLTLDDVVVKAKKETKAERKGRVKPFPRKTGWKQKPHKRKGHYRVKKNGEKIWIKPIQIN